MKNIGHRESLYRGILWAVALFCTAVLLWVPATILLRGVWAFGRTFAEGTLSSFKIGPAIKNSLIIVLGSSILALPLALGAAFYITEYMKDGKIRKHLLFFLDLSAAMPPILYGLFCVLVLFPLLWNQPSLLAGIFTAALMILPDITARCVRIIESIAQPQRLAARSLGASRSTVIRTVLFPACGGKILSETFRVARRVLFEGAALALAAGASVRYTHWGRFLDQEGATLTFTLFRYARQGMWRPAFIAAFSLLLLAAVFELLARLALRISDTRAL